MFEASVSQTPDQLHSLAELGTAQISLNSHVIGGTTPQGTTLRAGSNFARSDGTTSNIYEAVFANDQTDAIYRGETGAPNWSPTTTDLKGFGRLTNLAAAMANVNKIQYLKEAA